MYRYVLIYEYSLQCFVLIASARRQVLSDSTNRPTTNAFLREILYSDGDASRLLDDTSRALQVARDVFGDDAKVIMSEHE